MLSAYLHVLALVARADGVIALSERAALREAVKRMAVAPAVAADIDALLDLSNAVDQDEILTTAIALVRREGASIGMMLAEWARDSYVIAAIDGEVSQSEVEVIERLFTHAGIPLRRRATLHAWAEMAARQTIEGAKLFTESIV